MKRILRNSSIRLLDQVGAAKRYRERLAKTGPLVRVLCLHDVPDRDWFAAFVSLCAEEYHVLSLTEWRTQTFHPERINLLLTFDDGYSSWVEVVAPTLEGFQMQGLFFISSGLLDAAANEEHAAEFCWNQLHIRPRTLLSWDMAAALVQAGHAIGGHTVSHADLSILTPEECGEEIRLDKIALETKLECTLSDFAYPFGSARHITEAASAAARAAGYTHTYSAIPGFVRIGQGGDIPRLLIESGQSTKELQRWIEGTYDLYYKIRAQAL